VSPGSSQKKVIGAGDLAQAVGEIGFEVREPVTKPLGGGERRREEHLDYVLRRAKEVAPAGEDDDLAATKRGAPDGHLVALPRWVGCRLDDTVTLQCERRGGRAECAAGCPVGAPPACRG
jgi:hypothetical protein